MTKTEQKIDTNYTQTFDTDVARLLDIVASALYSNKDVFLRELVSNASDACDRLRYDILQSPDLGAADQDFKIQILKNTDARTLSLLDNGIGMNEQDLEKNLGTIAHSGTSAMMAQIQNKDDLNLIGQFGVGFYAAFMVAHTVEVISTRAGEEQTWHWSSDGREGFSIRAATDDEAQKLSAEHGTLIILHLKDDASEYLVDDKIKQIIATYSDHIDVPVFLDDGETPLNAASALWTRPKSEITAEQYKEFYHHIAHAFDDPLLTAHWRAEGVIEYTGLLFVPTMRPFDLYDPARKSALRLYVKRVYITDEMEGLIYPWLRFVRGIIDSEDLPLNISREMLQQNPIVHKIRNGITKKILSELAKTAENDKAAFENFWYQFGAVLKEGLYDAAQHRADIFKVCRFASTFENGKLTSLESYIERMKDGQDEIYYITGENVESLLHSPQIEGFRARGLEVLILADTVDSFWLQNVPDYQGKKFISVTKGTVDLSKFDVPETDKDKNKGEKTDSENTDLDNKNAVNHLVGLFARELKDDVGTVRISNRLTESPVCLVADETGVDMHMENVLKIQQKYDPNSKRVLEINKDHALIQKLAHLPENDPLIKDAAQLLYDQATIIQGESVKNPAEFASRMANFMTRALK